MSPDGSRIVYVGQDSSGALWLYSRTLESTEPVRIPGTSGAYQPFVSADGASVGFFQEIRRDEAKVLVPSLFWSDLRYRTRITPEVFGAGSNARLIQTAITSTHAPLRENLIMCISKTSARYLRRALDPGAGLRYVRDRDRQMSPNRDLAE